MRYAVAAAFVAIVAAIAAPTAQADRATNGLYTHPFSVSCGENGAPAGTYCGPYTVNVTTAGWLEVGYSFPLASNACEQLDLEYSIDGRVWRTVRPAIGALHTSGASGLVTPGPHAISLRGSRVNANCVPASHFFGYLNLSWTVPRINRLDLSFADRLAAAKRELQPAAQRIARRKTELERLVLEAKARGQAALNRKTALDAQLRRVYDNYLRTRRALARLYSLQPRQEGSGQGFTQAISQVGNRIGRLEATIVEITRRTGRTPASLQGNLTRERRTLTALQEGLDERRPRENRDLRRRWRQGLQDSQDQLHDLRVAEASADYARATSFADIRELFSERTTLDREAFVLADRIKTFDLDVREIRVTAGGELVYHVTGRREDYERLRDLNERIELARQALAALDAKREKLGDAFFARQREVIAAEALLASRIMTAAGLRAFVDFAFNLFDVGVAFARGGPIGALSETAKKVLEQAIAERVAPSSSGFAPDSIEARINEQYKAGLKEAITGERIGSTVAQRVLKETVLKAGRDTLNQWLAGEVFGDLGVAFASTPSGASPLSRSLPSLAELRKWNGAARYLDHTEGQIKSLKQGFRLNRGSLGSALEGALKDLAKTSFKKAIDELEEAAWRGFMEKELIARSYYGVYKVAVDLSFDAFEAHDALLAAKQRILEGVREDDSAYRLHVSKTFADGAALELRLTLVRQTQAEVALALVVGGARAEFLRREGDTLVYRLGARSIDSGDEGLALLEVR